MVVVGYTGFEDAKRLRRRLQIIPSAYRPNAALVVGPGLFEGFGMSARGPVALYAFCIAINRLVHRLRAQQPNLVTYVRGGDPVS